MAIIMGTAGHIDHGKSSLVKALTHIDPDRLQEEKKRGMSIELGFCPFTREISVIDVPGHERFIRTMVSGIHAIDLALFVVAANEGIMPQSLEHRDICEVLGIPYGILVLSKADLLTSPAEQTAAKWKKLDAQLDDFVHHTFLQNAPRIRVSTKTGEGMPELLCAIQKIASKCQEKSLRNRTSGPFRMWIDRCFTLKGKGTIVTGTTISGKVTLQTPLYVYPSQKSCRVRHLEIHGQNVSQAKRGHRTALNLLGLEKEELSRGHILSSSATLGCEKSFLAAVELFQVEKTKSSKPICAQIYLGTGHALAKIRKGKTTIPCKNSPREFFMAQVLLDRALPFCRHDRFILRDTTPNTVGGGIILDVFPKFSKDETVIQLLKTSFCQYQEAQKTCSLPLAQLAEEKAVHAFFQDRGQQGLYLENILPWLDPQQQEEDGLRKILNQKPLVCMDGKKPIYLLNDHLEQHQKWLFLEIKDHNQKNPLSPGLPRAELISRGIQKIQGPLNANTSVLLERILDLLLNEKKIRLAQNCLTLEGETISLNFQQKDGLQKVTFLLQCSGLTPPNPKTIAQELEIDFEKLRPLLQFLMGEGIITKINADYYLENNILNQFKKKFVDYLQKNGELDVTTFKNLSGVTRKHAIPLLEYFDRQNITLRVGNVRKLRNSHRLS